VRGTGFYEKDIMINALIDLIFVILFLIYGIRLYINVERTFHKQLYPVAILSAVFFICYVVRAVIVIERRANNLKLIQESTPAYIFTWLVPDLVPMTCEVIVIYRGILLSQAKAKAAVSSTPSTPRTKNQPLTPGSSVSDMSIDEDNPSHENQEEVGLLSGK